jgi:hypothetical protein
MIGRLTHDFVAGASKITRIPTYDMLREDDLFDINRFKVIFGHLFVGMGADTVAFLANRSTDTL